MSPYRGEMSSVDGRENFVAPTTSEMEKMYRQTPETEKIREGFYEYSLAGPSQESIQQQLEDITKESGLIVTSVAVEKKSFSSTSSEPIAKEVEQAIGMGEEVVDKSNNGFFYKAEAMFEKNLKIDHSKHALEYNPNLYQKGQAS